MFETFNDLKLWQKIGLVAAVMGLPVLVVSIFLDSRGSQIATARDELRGIDYLAASYGLFDRLAQHRGLANAVLNGDTSLRNRMAALEPQIEADLGAVEAIETAVARDWGGNDALGTVRQGWRELRQRQSAMGAQESFAAHTRLLADVRELILTVADKSQLILDPDLDSYHVMDAMVNRLPATVSDLAYLRDTAAGVAAHGRVSAEEAAQISYLSSGLAEHAEAARRALRVAGRANQGLERSLTPPLNAALSAGTAFGQALAGKLATGATRAEAREEFDNGQQSVEAWFSFGSSAAKELRALLDSRIARMRRQQFTQIGAILAALVAAILLAVRIVRGINRQVGALTHLFSEIGMGNFAARAEVTTGDELGMMAVSLNAMLDNTLGLIQSREERDRIQESIQKLLNEISAVSDGDLTVNAEGTAELTGALADSFNMMIGELRGLIGQVEQTTRSVTGSATEVLKTAEHLAQGSEAQSRQIVDASAAIDEMALSIQQVSTNASSASSVADQALTAARSGADTVQKTMTRMSGIRQQVQQTSKRIKRLGESSQEIGEIVQLIGDIADRTSILALNASIQAATAGDAGKGFAVVAEEVERLADRATEATKKIASLIKSIQSDTNEAITAMEETTHEVVGGTNLATEAGQKLTEIEQVSHQLSELIQSISLASKQQARGSESVAKSMTSISTVTQQNAAGAKQAAISIRRLATLADGLRSSMDRFKLTSPAQVR
ncbi:MAG: methyl-accepting chemotaxis protein [Acidobacteria bacterium]|nr:methyl-accepting chemotaxis protein [Acidobacteriota bacterium]